MRNALNKAKIVCLGTGFMASALIGGGLAAGVISPGQIYVRGATRPERVRALCREHGVRPASDADIRSADLIILAFKPQTLESAAGQYAPLISLGTTVFSILAGISCAALEQAFPGCAAVRLMPNLALSVGLSVTGYCPAAGADDADCAAAETLFGALGTVCRVPEQQISLITALSGSGPAYFYYLAQIMAETAAARGMDSVLAERLAVQTLIGAARLLEQDPVSPAQMRARVTSKGGTTAAAIAAMAERGVAEAVAAGMDACVRRSDQLACPQKDV